MPRGGVRAALPRPAGIRFRYVVNVNGIRMHVLKIQAKAGAHNGVLSLWIPHPPAIAWATSCRRSGSRTTSCRACRSTGRPARALAKVFERDLGYQWQATWAEMYTKDLRVDRFGHADEA